MGGSIAHYAERVKGLSSGLDRVVHVSRITFRGTCQVVPHTEYVIPYLASIVKWLSNWLDRVIPPVRSTP